MQNNKGFTLLEITVVIAIITLLSAIFLANYRGGEKQFALQRSSHKLAQDIRTVEEMALSSREFKESGGGLAFPRGGYGLYFTANSSSYILFVDCDNEKDYDTWGSAGNCNSARVGAGNSINNEKIGEFSLESGIKISDILCPSLTIIFLPPNPDVTIKCGESVANAADIILSSGSQTVQVSINSIGQIDIQ